MIGLERSSEEGGVPGDPNRSEAARRAWETRRREPGEGVPAREKNKGYQKRYYSEHRKELSKKRKARYQADAEYREQLQERALATYRKKREKLEKERRESGWTRKARGFNRPRVMQIHGKDVLLYSPGEFAHQAGVSAQTIGVWEDREVLPPPTIRDELHRRWYSAEYVKKVSAIVREFKTTGGMRLSALKAMLDKALGKAASP